MASRTSHFFPSVFELVGLGFAALLLMILSSSQQLLEYYSLSSSGQLLKDEVGGAINTSLTKLDNYSFTAGAVTFAIWAVIGLLCFSVVRAFARVYREIETDTKLSSNKYVHPSTFKRADFWRQVIEDFALMLLSVVLLIGAVYLLIGFVIPIAITYGRTFLLAVSVSQLGGFLLGLAMLYVGLVTLDVVLRFALFHRRLLSRTN